MEHYIKLIDGTRIEAFPKAVQPETIKEDKFALDTTGEYLQIGRRKRKPKRNSTRDKIAQQRGELLCRNLHRLIAESDKILADSRMFLAPVPIQNGLAYTGTSGFHNPTLGVYIEWWKHHKCAWVIDESGEKQPLVYIAGSPFGTRRQAQIYPLMTVGFSLMRSAYHGIIVDDSSHSEAR